MSVIHRGRQMLKRLSHPLWFAALVFLVATIAVIYIYSGCCITLRLPIRSDGYGYYAYLTSVFVDHDLTMKTAMAYRRMNVPLAPVAPAWTGIAPYAPTGRLLDKYTLGTALLQTPFFLAAQLWATLARSPPYSPPYQFANVLSAIFFLAFGTCLLVRSLVRTFAPAIAILSAAGVIFGTSLFHDATFITSFSHVYSYFAFALLVVAVDRYQKGDDAGAPKILRPLELGAITGLIALIRVPNVVAGLIPLVLISRQLYRTGNFGQFALEFVSGVAAFAVVFGLQMAYWFAVTGHIVLNSYQGEYFDWTHPRLWEFLFSVRRGLFLWSPLLLLAVLGVPRLVRRDPWIGTAIAAVLLLELYICSSWWSWWYGMSFESRPVADMMPLVAFPLAHGLELAITKLGRRTCVVAVSGLILLNSILMLSYWKEFIPWDNPTSADILRLPQRWVSELR
ncbi:MAG TPA: hypothetical protein VF835_05930 [Rhizomicrobium sp.]